ncbi:NAD(P)-dependent oxidoreductase [Marinobacteraceae bacterium S3BR75-40.1]
MNVTFIGLGIMGSRMARNLLSHPDVTLTVYNRSPDPIRALQEQGAHAAESASQAVREADLVITMLASPEVVNTVALGDHGFLSAMPENALWMDCSTVNPSFTDRAAQAAKQQGIRFMDAPVAGTREPAEKGELTFLVGGSKDDFAQVESLLQTMGSKIVHVGETGRGSSLKMLVNAMLAQSMLAFAETTHLGEKLGFSRDFLMDTLPKLPVTAPFLTGKAELIRSGNFDAQFPMELMYKDLHLLAQTAYEHQQPLYLANLAKEVYGSATANGYERKDFAAVFEALTTNTAS